MDLDLFKTTITDRMDIIGPRVANRKTLDLGIVDSRRARKGTKEKLEKFPSFLFSKICTINPEATGVDIDAEGINLLRAQGYNTVVADVITMDLGEKFQTIVAGEIIEHLANPGLFLSNMKQHLTDDGVVIITTPNPFYAKQAWKILHYKRPSVHEEHTCWFDPITLTNLCRMSGLEPVEGYWIQPRASSIKTFLRYIRRYFSHSFMVVARPLP